MACLSRLARYAFLFILCLFLLLPLAACGGADTTEDTPLPSGVIDVAEIIETLTAPEMRGRLVGTPENALAAQYLHDLFALLELAPFAGEDFFHAYRQEVFDIELADPRLTVTLADGTERALQLGSEFQFRVDQGPVDVRLTAVSDLENLDDSGREDRIYTPGEMGLMTLWMRATWPHPVAWAFFPVETPMVSAPWSRFEQADGSLYSPFGFGGFASDLIMIGIDAALYDELMEIGITEAHLQSEDARRMDTVHNVIGVLEGRDRTRAVIISAHFDGTGFLGDVYTQAAIDNASGVAAVLYAASILSERRDELEIDVVFAAFNGEEGGLLGSFAFASEAGARYAALYNINIDCVGVIDWEDFSICAANSTNNALRNAFRAQMEQAGFAYNPMPYGLSDHLPFAEMGFPAISFGQLDDRIHSPEDRAEFLDFAEIERVGRMVADFVLSSGAEMYVASRDFDPELIFVDDDFVFEQVNLVLEELGGLAYDEAYQFMLADGRHVMLTGWRPLVKVEEVARYYPNLHLPEEVGEFQFQYFTSFGLMDDFMLGDRPFQYGSVQQALGLFSDLPVGEVFPRDIVLHGFSMIYENPLGERVLLMVGWGRHLETCGVPFPCTIYGDIHFVQMPGEGYAQAIYHPDLHGLIVTMEIIDTDCLHGLPGDMFSFQHLILEFDAFFALAELFDLPGLAERFAGRLVPWTDERAIIWVSPPCSGWT